MSILQRARAEIRNLKPYISARDSGLAPVLLNANENPWGGDFQSGGKFNRYPEPQPTTLRRQMAAFYGAEVDNILITRGSDEAIDLLVRAFCQAGNDAVLQCPPCFGMYAIAARIQGAEIIDVPLISANDFALDLEGIKNKLAPNTKVVFLTSPNNPTGNALTEDEVLNLVGFLSGRALLVLDEAYIEFSQRPSLVSQVNRFDNLVILRTLSKAFGLAGLRCGACIADPGIIQLLQKILPPYPLPQPSIALARQALSDRGVANMKWQLNQLAGLKQKLVGLMDQQAWVKRLWPGEANFILAQVEDAKDLCQYLADQQILIRDFSNQAFLSQCVRITVGNEQDLARLEHALEQYQ